MARVIVQYPNFFGRIEPLKEIEEIAHKEKSLFVVSSNPLALGVLTPPGKLGADIVSWRCTTIWNSSGIWWTALWLFCRNK